MENTWLFATIYLLATLIIMRSFPKHFNMRLFTALEFSCCTPPLIVVRLQNKSLTGFIGGIMAVIGAVILSALSIIVTAWFLIRPGKTCHPAAHLGYSPHKSENAYYKLYIFIKSLADLVLNSGGNGYFSTHITIELSGGG